MIGSMNITNFIAYCLQIGMLIALAGCIPSLLRLHQPRARLIYWYLVLAACVLLPLAQPWKPTAFTSDGAAGAFVAVTHVARPQPHFSLTRSQIIMIILIGGVLIRLFWLAVGFWKLRRYRRHSLPLDPAPSWAVEADVRVSGDVPSPVTFGWRKPVVLLPEVFQSLDQRVQDAILCHEILHVRRGDWLFTMAEELLRSVFWFHPAIWWLLGEIGLAREQEVDRLAIEITNERDQYMDALLAIAGAHAGLDLAPAPLFLRKRHLKQRVVLILKESRMSKMKLMSALTASVCALAAACWLVTGAFPLLAAPQTVNDAPGVTVSLGGASVLHRTPVQYPLAAQRAGVMGTLMVEVKIDSKGNVVDARVLSGPDELRRSALESVLQWHFASDSAGATRVVQITYEGGVPGGVIGSAPTAMAPPPGVAAGVPAGVQSGVVGGTVSGVPRGVPNGVVRSVPAGEMPPPPPRPLIQEQIGLQSYQVPVRTAPPAVIRSFAVAGLSESASNELRNQLSKFQGQETTAENVQAMNQVIHNFDEHLVFFMKKADDGVEVQILAPGATPGQVPAAYTGPRIKVGGNVQAAMIINRTMPAYPPLAKAARVEGVVHLAAIIGPDGTVVELHSLGGPALLIQAAMDAVKNWVYRTTLLNGQPTAVETTIDVNFTLNQ